MNMEERLEQIEKINAELRKEVDFLKFRIDLVAVKTNVNQILYEYEINKEQYNAIMDLMDEVRQELSNHKEYSHNEFETRISKIFENESGLRHDYHFAEAIAQAFMEDGRWEEVFPALYGDMLKFKNYIYSMKNERR